MSGTEANETLDRLLAVDWSGETALIHRRSRLKLLQEYLRRSALWAQRLEATGDWPFFDVAEYTNPDVLIPDDLAVRLRELVDAKIGWPSVARSCWAMLRWAAAADSGERAAGEDPYAPLLLFFERGGGFWGESGFLEVEGGSIRLRPWNHYLDLKPLDISPANLEALDAADPFNAGS